MTAIVEDNEEDFLGKILEADVPKVEERRVKEALTYARQDLHFFNVFWINNISKTPHNPVDIVDDVTKKVILRVPAMLVLKGNARGLGSELDSIKNELESTPVLRNVLVGNAIVNNLSIVSNAGDREGWCNFLTYYGYQDLLDQIEESATSSTISNSLSLFDD